MQPLPTLSRRGLICSALGVVAAAPVAAATDRLLPPFGLEGTVGTVSPWLKSNVFVKRLPGTSAAEFAQHWLDSQAKLLAQDGGLQRCVLNVVDRVRSPDSPFDGITELFYRSEADYDRSRAAQGAVLQRALAADGAKFLASDAMRLFTREIVIRDFSGAPPPGAVKRLGLVRRRPELGRAAFLKDWRDVHAPEANAMTGVIRYTLNIVEERLSPDATWDGYAELWWQDRASYEAASRQRLAERTAEEKRGIIGPTLPALLMMVEPHQIV